MVRKEWMEQRESEILWLTSLPVGCPTEVLQGVVLLFGEVAGSESPLTRWGGCASCVEVLQLDGAEELQEGGVSDSPCLP